MKIEFINIFRVLPNVLAMARPSTMSIEKYNIIQQFKRFTNKFSYKLFFKFKRQVNKKYSFINHKL